MAVGVASDKVEPTEVTSWQKTVQAMLQQDANAAPLNYECTPAEKTNMLSRLRTVL